MIKKEFTSLIITSPIAIFVIVVMTTMFLLGVVLEVILYVSNVIFDFAYRVFEYIFKNGGNKDD